MSWIITEVIGPLQFQIRWLRKYLLFFHVCYLDAMYNMVKLLLAYRKRYFLFAITLQESQQAEGERLLKSRIRDHAPNAEETLKELLSFRKPPDEGTGGFDSSIGLAVN